MIIARSIQSTKGRGKRSYATTSSHFPQRTNLSNLKSGLGVASEVVNGETATIGVFVNTGSVNETHQNNGVSNFLSQVALKGTKKRTGAQIQKEVENIGGSLRSYSTKERTAYIAKVHKSEVPQAVDILSDIIQNAVYSKESIDETRGEVLHAKATYENDTVGSLFTHLHTLAFQGTPLGLTLHGTTENIENFQRDDIINYLNLNYTADRMIVVGVGAVEHSQLAGLVEEKFTSIPKRNEFVEIPQVYYTGSAVEVLDNEKHFVHGAIAYRGVDHSSADLIPLHIIKTILGDYSRYSPAGNKTSSRLGEILASCDSAEYFHPFHHSFNSIGLFGAHFKTSSHTVEDFCCSFISELVRISQSATAKEVDLAKNKLKAAVAFSASSSDALLQQIADQFLSVGRRISNEELFARIDAVDLETIRDVALRYLTDAEPVSVAVGDIYHYPDYNQLRAWTYWNRL